MPDRISFGPFGPTRRTLAQALKLARGWHMVSSLADSERVRRLLRHHTRSASPCGVSYGPRACWVRVPADSLLSGSGGRRLLIFDLNELRQDVFVVLLEVTGDPFIADEPTDVSLGKHEFEMIGAVRLLNEPELPIQVR